MSELSSRKRKQDEAPEEEEEEDLQSLPDNSEEEEEWAPRSIPPTPTIPISPITLLLAQWSTFT